jgi:predicted regulator of Ras-like GTPase activity (Roadblock/LC7/MglB family)
MEPTPVQQAALSQLAAVPGVVGSMVFDPAGAVAFSAFPPPFDPSALRELAGRLSSDAFFQEWMAGDRAVLDLRFADGHVVVRALERAWILVLCTVQVNAQLLSMSLTQVLRRLKLGGEVSGEFPLPAAPAAAPRPPEPTALDRLRAMVQAELGPQAPQALELLAAAGPARKDLERAVADVEKLIRLFISKKKAEELGRRMAGLLEISK